MTARAIEVKLCAVDHDIRYEFEIFVTFFCYFFLFKSKFVLKKLVKKPTEVMKKSRIFFLITFFTK